MPSASRPTPRNLGEIRDIYPPDVPDDEYVAELRAIRHGVERTFNATGEAFAQCHRDVAVTLRALVKRCADELHVPIVADFLVGCSPA
jgi:hypothetical protein